MQRLWVVRLVYVNKKGLIGLTQFMIILRKTINQDVLHFECNIQYKYVRRMIFETIYLQTNIIQC